MTLKRHSKPFKEVCSSGVANGESGSCAIPSFSTFFRLDCLLLEEKEEKVGESVRDWMRGAGR